MKTKEKRKRVALVTGGSRGIGLGCARQLAAAGFDLCLCGRRPHGEVTDPCRGLEREGARVLYVVCDVGDRRAREAMIGEVRTCFGRLDVLVNNAGMAPRERRDILEAGEESFNEVMRANLAGPYFLTQSAARWMIEQKKAEADFSGVVVNISSVSAEMASLNRGEYCISKAGIGMATRLWALRLAPEGIGVYEVRPGIIATDMTAGVKKKYDRMIGDGLIPEGRWGRTDDVGRIVASLAEGALPYATGSVIMADGGLSIPKL